ncbi:hypothetical protein KKH23_07300 [Patescibacteria group bacterium]|nr:hypothetical protein [Patescibacteria group bacterium]MBU1067591.1 hypothetical protein [Patescibacteria group bacterium]
MKVSKKKLAEMLIQCNEIINEMHVQNIKDFGDSWNEIDSMATSTHGQNALCRDCGKILASDNIYGQCTECYKWERR